MNCESVAAHDSKGGNLRPTLGLHLTLELAAHGLEPLWSFLKFALQWYVVEPGLFQGVANTVTR